MAVMYVYSVIYFHLKKVHNIPTGGILTQRTTISCSSNILPLTTLNRKVEQANCYTNGSLKMYAFVPT